MDIFYFVPSLLSAVLPRRWRCFQLVPLRWWLCFQFVPPRWRLCFQFVPLRWRLFFSNCAFLLSAVLSARAAPLVAVLSDCTSPWRLCFQIVPLRCQIYFQTVPHNKTCLWKAESREFVFFIRKSIEKSIRKSDSTTRSVRPILWTQAVAVAVHMYTSTALSIYPPICTHCTSKSQPPYNHRTIYHAITVQASYAQSVAKVQALCKHRTLNVPTKCKRCASIVRSICRQSASTAQTTPFLPTFLCLSLQNLPFHPSSCSQCSQNG